MALPVRSRPRDTVAGWGPFREVADLTERVDSLWGTGFAGQLDRWVPSADVAESEDAFAVEIELPGVRRDDLDVQLVDRVLTVSAAVREKERTGILHRRTRRLGRFHYAVTMPNDVDAENVSARLHDGVLSIRVPKAEAAEPRRIAVSS